MLLLIHREGMTPIANYKNNMKISKTQLKELATEERAQEWNATEDKWLYTVSLVEDSFDLFDYDHKAMDWCVEWLEEYLYDTYLITLHESKIDQLMQEHEDKVTA